MTTRKRLLLAYGGRSSEHPISVRSATEVLAAIDRTVFEPVLLGITRDGSWKTGPTDAGLQAVLDSGQPVTDLRALNPDVVLPILHGPHGEDGVFQGLCAALDLPCAGSGVLASALCMDKALQKHVMASAAPNIPLLPWVEVRADDLDGGADRVRQALAFPCFIKPANMGSSVGVSRATDQASLIAGLADAARYDDKIVVEEGLSAPREIELAVLGNGGPDTLVSEPGEIVLPDGVWYDYETKYEKDVATYRIPTQVPDEVRDTLRAHARQAFEVMGCAGMARVDFLLDRSTNRAYLNEVNTIPGFTSISMYPKLMEHAGVPYSELITRLCDLARATHEQGRERP